MNISKSAYKVLAVSLLLVAAYLYAKGLSLRVESFGLGLSYILPAVTCLGLAIVSSVMALLESEGGKCISPMDHY